MSLRYAILGLLARREMTGYDLTKHLAASDGLFWSAKHSQIYPELAALTRLGLVQYQAVAQIGRPEKKVYVLTPEGHRTLGAWVGEPPEARVLKDPMLIKVWALGTVSPQQLEPVLRRALRELEQKLNDAPGTGVTPQEPGDRHTRGVELTQSFQRHFYAMYRTWLLDCLQACQESDVTAGT
ncbi:MAG: helix-turn-helix transcriptional regulator [Candidatus Sericytochromatia bacterium]|nr:helix-turn-helix transcriptional regulator [Candidatus Sericytochromatia bacterium]